MDQGAHSLFRQTGTQQPVGRLNQEEEAARSAADRAGESAGMPKRRWLLPDLPRSLLPLTTTERRRSRSDSVTTACRERTGIRP
jgi:hypothetical protein